MADHPRIHSISMASAIAIVRLLDDPPETLLHDAAAYVELARVNLALDNSAITAAMMFAQPLIKMWRPHWKFAFTVGLSIGAKFTTEGFFVADIIQHVTNEFTLDCLKEGEGIAIEMFDWANINQRCRNFRNALVNVALEEPLPAFEMPPPPMPNVIGQPDVANLHVLIVDDSEIICSVHEALVLQIRPDARTHMCHTVPSALEYLRVNEEAGTNVNLILLDLNLSLPDGDEAQGTAPALDDIMSVPNGFNVAAALDAAPSVVPIDFRFKPFVAMVSYLADRVLTRSLQNGQMAQDGSLGGCDALLPKPLNADTMRVLIEGCGV